ncbi:hypothetical protein LIER_29650 [Lithospermum erythrorhizon]|uniref:Uncharacterized protein n=1 Tax=Lithospermum erythrorhizon TaxID=34254 RepID=A0AAV3RLD8_LITER
MLVLFGDLTGLKLNCSKSSIFFRSTPCDVRSALCDYMEISEGVLPVKYLGMRSSNSLTRDDYNGLVDRICGKVEKRLRCFLWSGKDEGPYIAKVDWSTACLPLAEGGFRFQKDGYVEPSQCPFGLITGALWGLFGLFLMSRRDLASTS